MRRAPLTWVLSRKAGEEADTLYLPYFAGLHQTL